jgi:rubrerythrin
VMSVRCENCGNVSSAETNFCRFCGTRFTLQQQSRSYDFAPPRPYAWKTDEFQTQTEARKTLDGYSNAQADVLAYRENSPIAIAYRCPNCMGQFLPQIERRISTTGWIVFSVLLVMFFPLFWVGFLIKEDVRVCPSCKARFP